MLEYGRFWRFLLLISTKIRLKKSLFFSIKYFKSTKVNSVLERSRYKFDSSTLSSIIAWAIAILSLFISYGICYLNLITISYIHNFLF